MTAHDTRLEHEPVQLLGAMALDWPLSGADDEALATHLRSCSSCRARVAALQADGRALRLLDLGDAPAAVRARVAVHAGRTLRRQRGIGRGTAWLAAAALLLVTIGASIVGGVGGDGHRAAGPDATQLEESRVVFDTGVVSLVARELWVDAGGRRFLGSAKPSIASDPGDATFRTLEVTWFEHGVEMRIFLYFGGDEASWWVDEIRTYNGNPTANWLYARGPFFKAPNGAAWAGDADIPLEDRDGVGGTPASLHLGGAVIEVHPFDAVREPPGGGIALAPNDRLFEPGAPLHCAGILQLSPRDAERVLLSLGYRVSWRLVTRGDDEWEIRDEPPDGTISDTGTLVGSNGELILAVIEPGAAGGVPVPYPADCPPPPSAAP